MKSFSFRLGRDDEDIQRTLAAMSLHTRSKYVKDAIRFYGNLGDEIKLLNKQIAELSAALDGAPLQRHTAAPSSDNGDVGVDILEASISDLLGM
jgi:Arc/MetJ family transcription regulator